MQPYIQESAQLLAAGGAIAVIFALLLAFALALATMGGPLVADRSA